MPTITGVAGTTINATCTVSAAGAGIAQGESSATAQSMCNDLATISTGAVTLAGVKTFSAGITLGAACKLVGTSGCEMRGAFTADTTGTTTFTGFTWAWDAASCIKLLGRTVLRSARVPVADGNKRIGVGAGTSIDYAGKRFSLAAVPASPRTITLDHTHAPPLEGETVEVVWYTGTPASGVQFTFVREDATVVAKFASTADPLFALSHMIAEFEYVSGVWRLGMNSGRALDSLGPDAFGVLVGTGS